MILKPVLNLLSLSEQLSASSENCSERERVSKKGSNSMNVGVFLGAGHDSIKVGASANGFNEIDLSIDFRDKLAAELRQRGCFVLTDGGIGRNLQLSTAVRLAKTVEGPRIEFHCNSGIPKATGVEAFSMPASRPLASLLATTTGQVLGIPIRGRFGWKPENKSQHDRLVFCFDAFGVVLEMFFLTNRYDLHKFLIHREQLVVALADKLFHVKPA